ncbi:MULTISPECIES: S-methyl-5-thioribose-1-phosphate isomerase [Streptomyces]|uniref:Methylthioribose-1-phosphate isomerase n=1 Tax=Streptomyces stelliscabiei TaxID=146820 RepID=A0A8I0P582_9ACTN|nr:MULTISPECIES: S-methyl-5-thioribose-1-phosphate isomerase [Streptomyces]KND40833.1 initiation factor 2B subunit alpha [Streptomyces stelliscabiei]MBE1597747.1 methylthioribose-1-phosphate isomerase [Streptomyces stelliscabiei]MDX2522349.1 S-methyl-5-thioribose-1-phosphate isomerase [Streptomyces stelliscabiei]MDX2557889.1 S-methyl-5-thioribose-1-phosphate isomerase [Streptomyces stelliscabiei]MDX2617613.1 S-methyl-5-thioribose-1-phosphate isomerase [Streptomyces stelliscabiei]
MADQYARSGDDTRPTGIPAIRWDEPPEGPVLVLLDQTRLPAEEVELVCTDAPALVEAIRVLAVRGAPLLGIAGAYGVALAAVRGFDVEDAAEALEGARPTAVNLAVGVRRARAAHRAELGRTGDQKRAAEAALAAARALHREDAEASSRMAAHGLALLDELLPGGGHRVLTHCNTGALVSGGEGTAFAVALAAHRVGRLRRLWVDETRPLLQGARLTAYEAARSGMAYTLLTDNAAGSLFAAGEVDAVLVGADRIAADGSVANKVGTYPLAVLARYHHVPFIVVAPLTTVDVDTPDGASIEVEQRAGHEVTEITAPQVPRAGAEAGGGIAVAPLGTQAYNPAFDVTPPELVTAIVTEEGAVSPVTADALAELCDRSRQVTI